MFKSQQVGAIIVAAGRGERMGGTDKIFTLLNEMTALEYIATAFEISPYIDYITVVLNENNLSRGESLLRQRGLTKLATICQGGTRRQDSVLAGLNALPQCQWVLIHDGARPLLSQNIIADGLEAAQETGVASAAVPITDTIKLADDNHYVQETLSRQHLWSIQTPQVFRFDIIKAGYMRTATDVTDDATLVETLGIRVKLYMGAYDNIKLTTPSDILLAQILLNQRNR